MSYREETDKKFILLQRSLLKELPYFLKDFFRSLEDSTEPRTRIAYAYDLRIFFEFLVSEVRGISSSSVTELLIDDLKKVNIDILEDFMEYLTYYVKNIETQAVNKEPEVLGMERHNQALGKSRKLSAVRSMFAFYYKKRILESNPAELIDYPKVREKAKVYLEVNEIAQLLDEVESGENLSKKQAEYHNLTKKRDLAILTLLLGTGIRVSECIGLNINDLDFQNGSFKVTRKGGDEAILYFGDEVEKALSDYLDEREEVVTLTGHEEALFLSLQNRRITDRAVQLLVKKYSSLVTQIKKITPHKLRTTFGTTLYRETGDIYLVADTLGHKDVNTTRKHYADIDKEQGRRAVKALKLRDDGK